jgi:septum site-determining protein MinC
MVNHWNSSNAVKIKGVGERLWVQIDPRIPVDELKIELQGSFTSGGALTAGADVVLDAGSREESSRLISELGPFLLAHFPVRSIKASYEIDQPTSGDDRRHDMLRSWRHRRSDALVLAGRVRSGQNVEARHHLLLLGDVNPGAAVSAGGDIIIMGSLCGTASAGQPDDTESIVCALDFRPTKLQIGSVVAVGGPHDRRGFVEFAKVDNGVIVIMDYLDADPFGKLPWPEVR